MSAYARRAIAERQRQHQIKSLLSGNNHTLVQMSSAEFVDYIISVKMKQGMTRVEVVDSIDELLAQNDCLPASWNRHKEGLKTLGSWFPVLDDVKALTLLAVEMKRQGNVFGKFKVKVYGNAPAVIINSYPGLKAHLNGTRYLASNPKLFTIGVGKLSANKAMKGGFVVSIIFSASFHFAEQVLNDDVTWHHFVAGVAVDMAVVGVTFAAMKLGIAGISMIVAGTALAPLAVVVAVGAFSAWYFEDTSEYLAVVAKILKDFEHSLVNQIDVVQKDVSKFKYEFQKDPMGQIKRVLGIPNLQVEIR
ncbi:hypothetical protein [Shewanella waksmanii]|uniref:hypothetical protein n=1 Tax=Shewanella waksmanii TaxID=213783 RepID=UPI003734F2B7